MKELIFHRLFLPTAERQASAPAFTDEGTGQQVTFGGHATQVKKLANGLRSELGIEPGDRVAVLSMNSLAYVELWHAALLGACVLNPLNNRFSARELAFVLADSGTRACFVDATYAPLIDDVRKEAGVENVVLIGEGDVPHDMAYGALVKAGASATPDEPEENDPAVLMYTGGTTGTPKGVLLEHRAEILNQYHIAMALPWVKDWTFLIQTPIFHGASMLGVIGAPAFGVHSVILPAFEPGKAIESIRNHQIDFTVMVPTMIQMVLGHPSFTPEALGSLKRLVYGASPMPTALIQRVLALLPDLDVVQGYGMTEAATVLTILTGEDHRRGAKLLTSAGRGIPGVELCVQDENGAQLAPEEVGEVCARGGNYMREYWNRAESTAETMRDGWYHSGDVGYLDGDGYLFLVDRAKDMIVTGGENVYCTEVENALASHPDVAQVAVIGVPDEDWGEAVHAIVVPRPGTTPAEPDIIAHARKAIAGYKVPKSVSFRSEPLPLSAAMKVLKRELREPFWAGRERSIN